VKNLSGIGWYGIDTGHPEWYKFNKEFFDFMVSTFPKMTTLSTMVSMPWDDNKIVWLDRVIEWCSPLGIKLLIVNDSNSLDESALINYWTRMAGKYKNNPNIAGFDLINEPWSFAEGNETIVQLYERIIDAIRSVDPNRTCYVQSMYRHTKGLFWVRTNPVRRDNVVYTAHLYSNRWDTGAWYPAAEAPWAPYYQAGDYTRGKEVLINGEGDSYGLYDRFGFVTLELGLPVAITEVSFIDTAAGHQYGKDVLSTLNEWNIEWCYWSWYSNVDRPMNITRPDGSLRGDIHKIINAHMIKPPGMEWWPIALAAGLGGIIIISGVIFYQEEERKKKLLVA